MTPILVPTLAELGIELGKAMAAEDAAYQAWLPQYHAGNGTADTAESKEADRTSDVVSGIIDQIAALPAASLADLRVKAMAMDWHNRKVETPHDFWTRLGAQLVAGLLDERIA